MKTHLMWEWASIVGVLATLMVWQPRGVTAQAPQPIDRVPGGAPYRILPSGGYLDLEGTMLELAHRAGIPTGLETSYKEREFRRSRELFETDFSTISLRETWQILQRFDPEYDARMFDGVLVIRPTEAWARADHPLHRRVARFEATKVNLPELTTRIATLLGAADRPYSPAPFARMPLHDWTLHLDAPSVLEILNAAAREPGHLSWEYNAQGRDGPFSLYLITVTEENYRVGWR